jgi:hypothetical protein
VLYLGDRATGRVTAHGTLSGLPANPRSSTRRATRAGVHRFLPFCRSRSVGAGPIGESRRLPRSAGSRNAARRRSDSPAPGGSGCSRTGRVVRDPCRSVAWEPSEQTSLSFAQDQTAPQPLPHRQPVRKSLRYRRRLERVRGCPRLRRSSVVRGDRPARPDPNVVSGMWWEEVDPPSPAVR